jgi:competence protein ComEC
MNSQFLRQNPFLRIVVFFILGISLSAQFEGTSKKMLLIVPTIILILSLILIYRLKKPRSPFFAGMLVYFVTVSCGIFSGLQSMEYKTLPADEYTYQAIVAGMPLKKEKSVQFDCRVTEIEKDSIRAQLNEKIRLYVISDTLKNSLRIGDSITFTARMMPIGNTGNPGEFDYKSYLAREKIHHSGFIKENQLICRGFSGKYRIRRLASEIQMNSIRKLSDYNFKGNELAVLSALAAGNRDLLNAEIINNYAATGAMHILSVSGLHVGILFLFLNLLLGSRYQIRYWSGIRFLIILLTIWLYAFITGLSAPVLRASVMFSLFLIGKKVNRQVSNLNILAASAMLILIVNPLELYNVGFQFSYLAVAGILIFQPWLQNLLEFKYMLPDRLWQLIAVSIAAQLITFPLGIYYFHQFPTWFLLTNIVVIPATWGVMMLTLLFYLLLPFHCIAHFIAFVLNFLLKLMNGSIEFISNLPLATLTNLHFNERHLILWYILIAILSMSALSQKKIFFIYTAGCLFLLNTGYDMAEFTRQRDQKELVVYSMRNMAALSLIDGHRHLFITGQIDEEQFKSEKKYLMPYWINRNITKNMVWVPLEKNNKKELRANNVEFKPVQYGYEISFYNETMLFLKQPAFIDNLSNPIESGLYDILLVNGASGYPRKEYLNSKPTTLIICQRLYRKQKEAWEQFAVENNLRLYDVNQNGAFILKVK